MATLNPQMAAQIARFQAKWQLGFISSEQVPSAAAAILEAGVETHSLAVLAGLINPSRSEADPYVRRFLDEVGAETLTDADARWLLVRAGVEAITAGTLAPREGADQLAFLCRDLGMPEPLRYFVYLSSDYDPTDDWFDERIRATAKEVLATLPPQRAGVAT